MLEWLFSTSGKPRFLTGDTPRKVTTLGTENPRKETAVARNERESELVYYMNMEMIIITNELERTSVRL